MFERRNHMASRVLHLAVANEIMKQISVNDKNRFRLGVILPDACNLPSGPKNESHLKVVVGENNKKTCDLDQFIFLFKEEINHDELYIGYYLHLVQDLFFRKLICYQYKWHPTSLKDVQHLHKDYRLTNLFIIKKYGVVNDIQMIADLKNEKINRLSHFEVEEFLQDMEHDFYDTTEEEPYFFTNAMADEFVSGATDACIREWYELKKGKHYINPYQYAWM